MHAGSVYLMKYWKHTGSHPESCMTRGLQKTSTKFAFAFAVALASCNYGLTGALPAAFESTRATSGYSWSAERNTTRLKKAHQSVCASLEEATGCVLQSVSWQNCYVATRDVHTLG